MGKKLFNITANSSLNKRKLIHQRKTYQASIARKAAITNCNMSAAEIDEEIAKFREVQEQLQRTRNDLQLVMQQLTENEMVKQELALLDSSTNVYKMVGPVLIKNSLEDANETVAKRLEFINGEKKRLEAKNTELETRGNAIAAKVQKMQANLQQMTAAAVQEIQKQAATGN